MYNIRVVGALLSGVLQRLTLRVFLPDVGNSPTLAFVVIVSCCCVWC